MSVSYGQYRIYIQLKKVEPDEPIQVYEEEVIGPFWDRHEAWEFFNEIKDKFYDKY